MATQPVDPQELDPSQEDSTFSSGVQSVKPQESREEANRLFREKYKRGRDLLLNEEFHRLTPGARRHLLNIIEPERFAKAPKDVQDDVLGRDYNSWKEYYAKWDEEHKPKAPPEKSLGERIKGWGQWIESKLPDVTGPLGSPTTETPKEALPKPAPAAKPQEEPSLTPPPQLGAPVPFVPSVQRQKIPGAVTQPKEETVWEKADRYSDQYGIPREITRAIIMGESGGNPKAVRQNDGGKGRTSRGLFQWNEPGGMGTGEPIDLQFDPDYVIPKSLKYLKPWYEKGKKLGLEGLELLLYIGRKGQVHDPVEGGRAYTNAWNYVMKGGKLPEYSIAGPGTAAEGGSLAKTEPPPVPQPGLAQPPTPFAPPQVAAGTPPAAPPAPQTAPEVQPPAVDMTQQPPLASDMAPPGRAPVAPVKPGEPWFEGGKIDISKPAEILTGKSILGPPTLETDLAGQLISTYQELTAIVDEMKLSDEQLAKEFPDGPDQTNDSEMKRYSALVADLKEVSDRARQKKKEIDDLQAFGATQGIQLASSTDPRMIPIMMRAQQGNVRDILAEAMKAPQRVVPGKTVQMDLTQKPEDAVLTANRDRVQIENLLGDMDPKQFESEARRQSRIDAAIKRAHAEAKGTGPKDLKTFAAEMFEYNENLSRFEPSRKALTLTPFVGPLFDAAHSLEILEAARAIRDNRETPHDIQVIEGFLQEQEEGRRDTTFLYGAAEIAANMPAYALEFATTGGAYTGTKLLLDQAMERVAKKVAGRAVENLAKKEATILGEKVTGKAAMKAARTAVTSAAAATVHTLVMPQRLLQQTLENQLPTQIGDPSNLQRLRDQLERWDDDFMPALVKALPQQVIENWTERMGLPGEYAQKALKEAIEPWVKQFAKLPLINKLGALKSAIVYDWLKRDPTRTLDDFFNKFKQKMAWHGLIGEWFEERMGDVLREINLPLIGQLREGDKAPPMIRIFTDPMSAKAEAIDDFLYQFGQEIAAFSVPTAVKGAIYALERGMRRAPAKAETGNPHGVTDEVMRVLRYSGFKDEEIAQWNILELRQVLVGVLDKHKGVLPTVPAPTPPAETPPPAAPEGGVPPVEGGVPPVEGGVPPVEGGVPPVEGGVPPVEGGVPPVEGVPPEPAPPVPTPNQIDFAVARIGREREDLILNIDRASERSRVESQIEWLGQASDTLSQYRDNPVSPVPQEVLDLMDAAGPSDWIRRQLEPNEPVGGPSDEQIKAAAEWWDNKDPNLRLTIAQEIGTHLDETGNPIPAEVLASIDSSTLPESALLAIERSYRAIYGTFVPPTSANTPYPGDAVMTAAVARVSEIMGRLGLDPDRISRRLFGKEFSQLELSEVERLERGLLPKTVAPQEPGLTKPPETREAATPADSVLVGMLHGLDEMEVQAWLDRRMTEIMEAQPLAGDESARMQAEGEIVAQGHTILAVMEEGDQLVTTDGLKYQRVGQSLYHVLENGKIGAFAGAIYGYDHDQNGELIYDPTTGEAKYVFQANDNLGYLAAKSKIVRKPIEGAPVGEPPPPETTEAPPTATQPTLPEDPDTIKLQLANLANGSRNAVFIAASTMAKLTDEEKDSLELWNIMPPLRLVDISDHPKVEDGFLVYRSDSYSEDDISSMLDAGKLYELLGIVAPKDADADAGVIVWAVNPDGTMTVAGHAVVPRWDVPRQVQAFRNEFNAKEGKPLTPIRIHVGTAEEIAAMVSEAAQGGLPGPPPESENAPPSQKLEPHQMTREQYDASDYPQHEDPTVLERGLDDLRMTLVHQVAPKFLRPENRGLYTFKYRNTITSMEDEMHLLGGWVREGLLDSEIELAEWFELWHNKVDQLFNDPAIDERDISPDELALTKDVAHQAVRNFALAVEEAQFHNELYDDHHFKAVEEALSIGREVPQQVLDEYPILRDGNFLGFDLPLGFEELAQFAAKRFPKAQQEAWEQYVANPWHGHEPTGSSLFEFLSNVFSSYGISPRKLKKVLDAYRESKPEGEQRPTTPVNTKPKPGHPLPDLPDAPEELHNSWAVQNRLRVLGFTEAQIHMMTPQQAYDFAAGEIVAQPSTEIGNISLYTVHEDNEANFRVYDSSGVESAGPFSTPKEADEVRESLQETLNEILGQAGVGTKPPETTTPEGPTEEIEYESTEQEEVLLAIREENEDPDRPTFLDTFEVDLEKGHYFVASGHEAEILLQALYDKSKQYDNKKDWKLHQGADELIEKHIAHFNLQDSEIVKKNRGPILKKRKKTTITPPPPTEEKKGPEITPPPTTPPTEEVKGEDLKKVLTGGLGSDDLAKLKGAFGTKPPGALPDAKAVKDAFEWMRDQGYLPPRATMEIVKDAQGREWAVQKMDGRAQYILGVKTYEGSDLTEIALREMLQNSVDALRGIRDGRKGTIGVTVKAERGQKPTIKIVDNGIGMSKATMGTFFVEPFASLKFDENGEVLENSSGGFGIAKVAIYGSADTIRVSSVNFNPETRRWEETWFEGTGDDFQTKGFLLNSVVPTTKRKAGTEIEITLNKPSPYPALLKQWCKDWLGRNRLPEFDINFLFNESPVIPAEFGEWTKLSEIGDRNFSGDIYYQPGVHKKVGYVNVHTLVNGFSTFEKTYRLDEDLDLPPELVIDIHPKADPAHKDLVYPLAMNRNDFSKSTDALVFEWIKNTLIVKAAAAERQKTDDIVYKGYNVGSTRFKVVDSNEDQLPPDVVKAISSDPIVQKTIELTAACFEELQKRTAVLHPDHADRIMKAKFHGYGLGSSYNGIIFHGDLKAFGEDHDPSKPYLILLNLHNLVHAGTHFEKSGLLSRDEAITVHCTRILSTLIEHELVHTVHWNHEKDFAAFMQDIRTSLVPEETKWRGILTAHFKANGYAATTAFRRYFDLLSAPRGATGDLLGKIGSSDGVPRLVHARPEVLSAMDERSGGGPEAVLGMDTGVQGGDSSGLASIADMGGSRPGHISSLDPATRKNLVLLGAHFYREHSVKEEWAEAVIANSAEWVRPYLDQVYQMVENYARIMGFRRPEAPPPPPPETQTKQEQYRNLVAKVRAAILAGESFNNRKLQAMANEVFGGQRGEGKYELRDMYDAFEAGVSAAIEMSNIVDFGNPIETLMALMELQSRLAVQSDRTMEQIDLQQFSTPPAQAFVAAYALGIASGPMSALEPSAGTGMLATMLRIRGAQVTANEIDERRLQMLQIRGFTTTDVDALHINTTGTAVSDLRPNLVLMNPPFSAGPTGKNTAHGARHIMQALQKLSPGGRLVAIIGEGMARGKDKFVGWWGEVDQKYTVRADIGLAGKFYQKMGTSFPQRLLVIDKIGPLPKGAEIVTGEECSPSEAAVLLAKIAEDDIYGRTTERSQPPSLPPPPTPPTPPGEPPTGEGTGGGSGGGGGRGGTSRGGRPGGRGGASGGGGGGVHAPGTRGEGNPPAPPRPPGPGEPGPEDTEGVGPRGGNEPPVEPQPPPADIKIVTTDRKMGEEESAVYVRYQVRKALYEGVTPHPAPLIESGPQASVDFPDVKVKLNLPEDVFHPPPVPEGEEPLGLSDAQLECVTFAVQALNDLTKDGRHYGFWIGDGTGVGKGREIAGIIYHYLRETGNKRALWLTATSQLLESAQRDINRVMVPMKTIHLNDPRYADEAPVTDDGILFTQYSTASIGWGSDPKRFRQIVDFLTPRTKKILEAGDFWTNPETGLSERIPSSMVGKEVEVKGDPKDFDGVIVFDESHKMKNAIPDDGSHSGSTGGTNAGKMGGELSKVFPKARIVYVSATGATKPSNMGYMDRLMLWGAEGSPFKTFDDFTEAMRAGGLQSMEMLARDLKAVGLFISRSLSYGGPDAEPWEKVEYGYVDHQLNEFQVEQYNNAASLFSELVQAMEWAEKNAHQRHDQTRFSVYYSMQQRFFLQLMTTYQIGSMFEKVDECLAQGMAPIINILSTNETLMEEIVTERKAAGKSLDDIDLGPRQMVRRFIEEYFPTEEFDVSRDPMTGKLEHIPTGEQNQANVEKQQELLALCDSLVLPDNPIDLIGQHFGGWSRISEISGREHRLENGQHVSVKPDGLKLTKGDTKNNWELRRFQKGETDVLVITAAGNAGISAHASRAAVNKKRRVMFCAQLSWSADQQMQFFGRAHRSNQASAPMIYLVRTNVRGQERLINAVSRRLASLGAFTQGHREALAGSLFNIEDFTDAYGKAACMHTVADLMAGNFYHPDMSGQEILTKLGYVRKDKQGKLHLRPTAGRNPENFLNRIMVLPVTVQNAVFDYFYATYTRLVQAAKEAGRFDEGVSKIRATEIDIKGAEHLYTDPRSGAETQLVEMEGSFESPRQQFEDLPRSAGMLGFYTNKRSGMIYAAYTWIDPQDGSRYVDLRSVKFRRERVPLEEFQKNYAKEDIEPAPGALRVAQDPNAPNQKAPIRWSNPKDETRYYEIIEHEEKRAAQGLPKPPRSLEEREAVERMEGEAPPLLGRITVPLWGIERARTLWNMELASIPKTFRAPIYMVTGAIFPVYDKIMGDNGLRHVRVVRAILKDGSGIIGFQVQANEITALKQRLGLGTELKAETGTSLFHMIRSGANVQLTNNWQIYMCDPIHGERRMEINMSRAYKESLVAQLREWGAIVEVIKTPGGSMRPRAFIPLDENDGPKLLDKIIEKYPADRVISTGTADPTTPPGSAGGGSGPSPLMPYDQGDGKKSIDLGLEMEPPTDNFQAAKGAQFWVEQAMESAKRIIDGIGDVSDQRMVHKAPIMAQRLLNWIQTNDLDQWLLEGNTVLDVTTEVKNHILESRKYDEVQAKIEANAYMPHLLRMQQELDQITGKEGISDPNGPTLSLEEGPVSGATTVPLLPPPSAMASTPPVLPPVAGSTAFQPGPNPQKLSRKDLVTKHKILKDLTKALNVPMRFGRFRMKALGIYKPRAEVIRLRKKLGGVGEKPGDLGPLNVAFHEAGHHINKLLWGLSKGDLNYSALAPFATELEPLATKPRAGGSKIPEGFAEYVRLWVTQNPVARASAPSFTQFFERTLDLNPDVKKALTTARDDFIRWAAQPASAKILAHISFDAPIYETNWWSGLYTKVINHLNPLNKVVKRIEKEAGKKLADLKVEDPHLLARLRAGWVAKADQFLNVDTFDPINLSPTGDGFRAILEPVRDRLDDLRICAIALRTLEKKGLQGREVGITLDEARSSLQLQGFDPRTLQPITPEAAMIWNALQGMYDYQDRLLRYYADSGMLERSYDPNHPGPYEKIKKMNKFYVPFHRLYEAGIGEKSGGSKGMAGEGVGNLWQPGSLKKFTGSWLPILDPLETIIKNTYTMINLADRNRVAQALYSLSQLDGAGWVAEPVPPDMRPTSFTLSEIRGALEAAGFNLSDPDIDLDAIATVFRPIKAPSPKENIITVHVRGKVKLLQLNPELYNAVQGLDVEEVNVLMRVLAVPAKILRLGATGINPEFTPKNILRDAATAFMQTSLYSKKHPLGFVPGWHSLMGLWHVFKRDDLYHEWIRGGGAHAAMISLDRDHIRQQLTDLVTHPILTAIKPRKWIDSLRVLSELSEEMTRVAVYKLARDKGMPIREAALESREATLDYSRMGAKMLSISMTHAFWNAAVQDIDKFGRTIKERPYESAIKGSALALISVLLWSVNKDDEKYQELPWWLKDSCWLFPTKGTSLYKVTPYVPIPKPFLWGYVFCNTAERMCEWIHRRDKSAIDEFLTNTFTQVLPAVPFAQATGIMPLLENYFNHSFFTGRMIETPHMQLLEPEDRAEWYTSKAAVTTSKAIAKIYHEMTKVFGEDIFDFRVSPVKLENLMFGYTAGAGRIVTREVVDRLIPDSGPTDPTPKMVDVSLARTFGVRYPSGGLVSLQKLQKRLQRLEMRYQSFREGIKNPGSVSAPQLTDDEWAEYATLKAAGEIIRLYHGQVRMVINSRRPEATPERKRKDIDAYYLSMLAMARSALKAADAIKAGRAKGLTQDQIGHELEKLKEEELRLAPSLKWPEDEAVPASQENALPSPPPM